MLNHTNFKFFISSSLMLVCGALFSQTQMLTEFKALPAFPADAKAAFAASKIDTTGQHFTYEQSSTAVSAYSKRLENDNKPYQEIIIAKGKKGMPTGMAVANDFSDLSSPETQARLANMTQEEKMKFAMEVQARMQTNKNMQSASEQIKTGPLTNLVLKLNASSQPLFATLTPYSKAPLLKYDKCNFHCGDQDRVCYEKMQVCNRQVARDYYTAEIARYNTFIKNIPLAFNAKKDAFEKDLKEFDDAAKKYSKEEIAVECSNVLAMLSRFALMVSGYEKQGAAILVEAKNEPYCKRDF